MAKRIWYPKGSPGRTTGTPTGPTSPTALTYALVLHLLCAGEIKGLVDDGSDNDAKLKSIYLDSTPVREADGTYNYESIGWADTPGTQGQGVISGFPDSSADATVDQEVTAATPVIRSISDPNADAAIVTIKVPALYQVDNESDDATGDMKPTFVEMAVDVQSADDPDYVQQDVGYLSSVDGKFTTEYLRQIRVELKGTAPWNIRVRRITPDSTDPTSLVNQSYWSLLTTEIDAQLSYPNVAVVALSIPSLQFSTPPGVSFLIDGKTVKLPSNYDPATRTYTGTWDGSFAAEPAWSDNPAWCFYDLLTDEVNGLGKYIDAANIDKWGLYSIAKYCDELVSDGKGGTEPRFRCNLVLQSRENAFNVLRDFASIFRGLIFWASGSVQVAQDAPGDSEYLFTPANVVDGMFNYTSSATRARHNVAIVSWNDPAKHYQSTREFVTDEPGLAAHAYNPVEVAALGCTSQGQAQRFGRWKLITERLETETVSFSTGLEGALRSPGAIITVQDPYRAGKRLGGRVVSATTTAVRLDADVTLEAGTYQLAVLLPDGTVEEQTVSSAAGTHRTLEVSTAFSTAPQADATWILTAPNLVPTLYRVLSVKENDDGTYQIDALRYEESKYDEVEGGVNLQPPPTSDIPSYAPVTGLVASEALYKSTAGIKVRLQASWAAASGAEKYAVRWRRGDGNWFAEEVVDTHFWEALDVEPGAAGIQVQAIIDGVRTLPTRTTYTILGKTAPPSDVIGLVAIQNPLSATLSWTAVADLDVAGYELRLGGTWSSASLIARLTATAYTWDFPPLNGSYTILVKAFDTSGNYSTNAASVVVAVADGTLPGAHIKPGTIGNPHINTLDPIQGTGIKQGTLTQGHLVPGTIINRTPFADGALNESGIFGGGVVDEAALKDGAVTGGKIPAGTILDSHINAAGLGAAHINESSTRKWAAESGATVGARLGTNLRDSLANLLADADVITSKGTAAEIQGQGALATKNEVDGSTVADGAIAVKKLLMPPSDNLVPNGYSEAGAAAVGLDPEGVGLVGPDDGAIPYTGDWCREFLSGADDMHIMDINKRQPCKAGESFTVSCMGRADVAMTSCNIGIFLQFFKSDGTWLKNFEKKFDGTATYKEYETQGTAPAGAGLAWCMFHDSGGSDAGRKIYADCIQMRKAVVAGRVQTTNYAEDTTAAPLPDGSYPASAGSKMDSFGAAFKVGVGGMYVGTHLIDDPFFRAANGLDGDFAAGRVVFRGSNNTDVRGGAPNIDCLSIGLRTQNQMSSGAWLAYFYMQIAPLDPNSGDDNLDGLTYATGPFYRGVIGVTVNPAANFNVFPPVRSRIYGNVDNNRSVVDWFFINPYGDRFTDDGAHSATVFLLQIANMYGKSDGRYFYPPSGGGGGAWNRSSTSPFPGSAPPPTGGGFGGIGGTCPCPEMPFLLANAECTGPGLIIPSGKVRAGAWAWAQDEHTGEWGAHEVRASEPAVTLCSELTLDDGRIWRGAHDHRFRVAGDFRRMHMLTRGTLLAGLAPGRVRGMRNIGFRPVQHISMETGGTYVTLGLTGHNIKQR